MNQNVKLDVLIPVIHRFLENTGYKKKTIARYKCRGLGEIQRYYEKLDTEYYSEKITWDFILLSRKRYEDGEITCERFQSIRKMGAMLSEYHNTGAICHHDLTYWKAEMPCTDFLEIINAYENSKLAAGYSDRTMVTYKSCIKLFLLHLESKGYRNLAEVSREDVAGYIPMLSKARPAGISRALCTLRSFLEYLFKNGLTRINLVPVLQVVPAPRTKIKLGFTVEEIEKILLAVDRHTSLGKRNYAMLLLAAYTGLRSVDVLNLKLRDIDWSCSEISITQRKTGRPLVLPLENNVGNAIAEYILHGRPSSDSSYLFLRKVPPHKNLHVGSAIGSRIVQKYAKLAGVEWTLDERKGFHSFRHALGAHMLAAEVPLHTISEVLGHANSDSTKPYLSADFRHLKMCALPLTDIECAREGLA